MKKLLALFLLLVLLGGVAAAQSSVWKAARDGNIVFLAGSVHILRSEDFPLPKEFDTAFGQSEVLTIETDIDQAADPQMAQALAAQMLLPENVTLKSLLSRDIYKRLDLKCREFGFSLEDAAQLKPSVILNILSVLQIQRYGFIEQGVDVHYLSRAKEEGKRIDFLESLDVQMDILMGTGGGDDDQYMLYSLENFDETEESLLALIADWKNGSSKNIELELKAMRKNWPGIYQTLIFDRNTSWMPLIEGYLATGTVEFVIAGLLHLHGPDGLLRQLENAGCAIEQVR